jgi:hypothetical protein
MGKKTGSGSGINNSDHMSESLETNFLVKVPAMQIRDVYPDIFPSRIPDMNQI